MADPTPSAARRRGRAARVPGMVFGALAGAVLILVATALNPAQPPPPAIAEYAPAAVQAITEAPPEQSTTEGNTAETGEGGAEGGGEGGDAGPGEPSAPPSAVPSPSASATPGVLPSVAPGGGPVIDVARVSRCVGNPPRQTEDPQSPPCIPYFEGDNGGATSRGVTADTIRIAMPNATGSSIEQLETYFNTRFQFYGRQIQIVRDEICFGGDPASAKKTATDIAALEVFGDVGYCDLGGVEYYFHDELARRGVVSVNNRVGVQTEADMAQFHPYQWSYLPTFDKGSRHLAELACSLNDKMAEHAGPPLTGMPRKFGLLTNTYTDAPSPDTSAVDAALAACGIDPVREQVQFERESALGQGASQQTAQQVSSAVLKMKQEGVTTIILLTHQITSRQVYAALEGQAYQPEIAVSTYLYNDEDLAVAGQPQSQAIHTFGISTWNKFVKVEDEPWYAAIKEVNPGHNFNSQDNPAPFSYAGARYDYHPLLMMAAGIQMAGPNLTPETFAKGLQEAAWPNPPTEKHPGKVTVSPGTHSYMEDAASIWWDPTNRSDYSNNGAFCYVDNGVRRQLGGYPADAGLFRRPCQRY